ncbi:MAG: ABC transporter permease [Gammaproteobacteria bacterium]
MSAARLFAIMYKEVLQLARDRLTFGMMIGIPLIQVLLFGFAINLDVRHLHAAVADQAGTQLSRTLAADAQASQIVDIRARVAGPAELEALLQRGEITVGLYFPPDFDRRVLRGDRPAAQILVDGSDPTVLGVARRLAEIELARGHPPETATRQPLLEVRNYFNPERRSAVFVVPALIGVILSMTMILFTAVALVRERERGNLELLIMTPVSSLELMLGKIIPYVLIGLVQVSLIVAAGLWIFQVPIAGTYGDIYAASLVFIAASLTMGLVISTLARSQFQAIQLTMFVYLPSILLSGFMFPFDGMPRLARWFAEVLPLTHFVRLTRGIILRGADLSTLASEIRALALFAIAMLAVAVLRFRKRLD